MSAALNLPVTGSKCLCPVFFFSSLSKSEVNSAKLLRVLGSFWLLVMWAILACVGGGEAETFIEGVEICGSKIKSNLHG